MQNRKPKTENRKHKLIFSSSILLSFCSSVLLFFSFSVSQFFVREARAAQERNDTAIFTGQVIPAYIGGAYDPTEGFKKLAGLPIYVFAYDSWQGTNFVIHNFAVRTQIRADGSFQAQGLPTAAHYGVYFPFFLEDPNNLNSRIVRKDNLAGNPAPQTAEFRWPVDADNIRDVFSYTVGNAGVTSQITDQFGNAITLGQAFLTNERKLDIENTINVFPVVPHRVLRVSVLAQSDFSYEVVGQRITRFAPAGQAAGLMPVLNFPVIRGRTSPSGVADNRGFVSHVFQAYAPDGFYAITVWQTGAGSETYKEWNTTSPLNAASSGIALLRVRKDWQESLADANQVYTPRNTIIVWGVVTDEVGNIMSDLNSAAGKKDLDISIKTDTDVQYGGRRPTDQSSDFYTPGQNPLPTHTVWGIYILSQNPFADSSPLNENFWVYIEEAGFKTNVTNPQRIIQGTDGPVRIDLTASKSDIGHGSGYDTGIHLYITDPNQTENVGCVPQGEPEEHFGCVPTAEAIIAPMQETRIKIPAVTKSYFANRLGEIHIPDSDLKHNEPYFVTVTAGNRVGFAEIMYPQRGEVRYAETSIQLTKPASASAYYKVLGVIPVPFMPIAYAQNEPVAIEGKLILPEGSKITGKVSPMVYRWDTSTCLPPECEVFYRDTQGNLVLATDLSQSPDYSFVLKITPPNSDENLSTECLRRFPDKPYVCYSEQVALNVATYFFKTAGSAELPSGEVMDFKGEQSITIDSAGVPTPLTLEIPIGIDCRATASRVTEGMPTAEKVILWGPSWGACQLGKFFIEKAPAAFGTLQRNFLQTMPVTKTGAVVNLWNIVRNLVNVLFIIFLLIIGITTILRIEPKTWSPGSLIPKLFLAIVLANFSLLLVQLFIDVNNVATEGIMQLALNALKGVRPASGGSNIILGSATGAAGGVVIGSLAGWISSISIMMLSFVNAPGILVFVLALFIAILLFLLGLILFFIFRYA
ncbi:MAG: hypothetical protein FJ044_00260, partial [Candidatus Cloacimonetes bacterium]|nr:hypothetical protein [Candidatus Cloacimonadota bacterium]